MWDLIVSVSDHCLSFNFEAIIFLISTLWTLKTIDEGFIHVTSLVEGLMEDWLHQMSYPRNIKSLLTYLQGAP